VAKKKRKRKTRNKKISLVGGKLGQKHSIHYRQQHQLLSTWQKTQCNAMRGDGNNTKKLTATATKARQQLSAKIPQLGRTPCQKNELHCEKKVAVK